MLFLTIIFSIFVADSEIDIAVPSFPEMRDFFNITPFMVELVLGVNLAVHCVVALIVGNLESKYGRKRIINLGFIIFIVGSFICAATSNYWVLLFGRMLQGAGVAPAMVLSMLVILDRHSMQEQERMMGLINGAATLSIAIAPVIGSYISLYFGWRGNFWVLFVLGIMAFSMFEIFVPKDKKQSPTSAKVNIIEYFKLLKNKTIAAYVISLCLSIGAYYAFIGLAPIIYIESLGVSLANFGLYQGSLTLAFGIFSIMSGKIMGLMGKKVSFFCSLFLMLAFVVASSALIIFNIKDPLYITLAMLLLSIGFVIPCNVMLVFVLNLVPSVKGMVSALISTLKWIFAVIAIQSASFFYNDNKSYTSTGIIITLMVFISLIMAVSLWQRDRLFRQSFQ